MGPHESAQWDPLDGTLRWDPAGQLDGPEDRRVEHYFEHVRLFRPPPWDPSKGPFHGTTPSKGSFHGGHYHPRHHHPFHRLHHHHHPHHYPRHQPCSPPLSQVHCRLQQPLLSSHPSPTGPHFCRSATASKNRCSPLTPHPCGPLTLADVPPPPTTAALPSHPTPWAPYFRWHAIVSIPRAPFPACSHSLNPVNAADCFTIKCFVKCVVV